MVPREYVLIVDLNVCLYLITYIYAQILHLQICCGDCNGIHKTLGIVRHKLVCLPHVCPTPLRCCRL